MRWPTPYQEHCRKRLQEALLSRFSSDRTRGDHGRPYFATVLGTGEIGPRRWSAGRTKRKPPKHGFYSRCASRRRPKGGNGARRSTDSLRAAHPEGTQREAAIRVRDLGDFALKQDYRLWVWRESCSGGCSISMHRARACAAGPRAPPAETQEAKLDDSFRF